MAEQGRIWSDSKLSVLFDVDEDDSIQCQTPSVSSLQTHNRCVTQQVIVKNVHCSYCDVINRRRCNLLNGLNVPGQ